MLYNLFSVIESIKNALVNTDTGKIISHSLTFCNQFLFLWAIRNVNTYFMCLGRVDPLWKGL